MKQWCYWDGQILKGPDGKYHMFASRWDQARGHGGWGRSLAVHAVSDKPMAVLPTRAYAGPENQGGKGHNVTALVLPDGHTPSSSARPGPAMFLLPNHSMGHGSIWGRSRLPTERISPARADETSASCSGPTASSWFWRDPGPSG